MENTEQGIQSVSQKECPHCGKEILISSVMLQPKVTSVFTHEGSLAAKKRVIELLDTIKFKDDNERGLVESWINDDLTVFGMGDVESILKTISINQIK